MSEAIGHPGAAVERQSSSPGFRLGAVDIDLETGTATGAGGSVHLDPKVLDVLVCLVAARGKVVSREALMKEVWDEVVVTDFALSRCIYQLRKTLSAVAQTDVSPIETLSKRGYRLTWPVEKPVMAGEQIKSLKSRIVTAVSMIALLLLLFMLLWGMSDQQDPDEETLAQVGDEDIRLVVFPLEDLSDRQDQQIFSKGLAREIMHELALLPGLCLIGRKSSFSTDLKDQTRLERAHLLGAEFLLEGSVVPIGSNRRVLIDLHTVPEGETIWSHSFLVEPNAPFHVVRRIARMTAALTEFSANPESDRSSTDSLEAFELYLQAFETDNIDLQRNVLQRAVELDPQFARAWNGLAVIEVMPVWNGEVSVEEAWARSRPFVERALEIDPGLPDAYVTLGRFKREFGEFDSAIELFQKAIELDPGHLFASANLGLVLRFTGRFAEALTIHEKDVAMDRLNALSRARLGTSYWFMEDHENAARQYEKAIELAPENVEIYDSWSGMLAMGLGQFDKALMKMDQKILIEGQPTPRTLRQTAAWASILGLDGIVNRNLGLARQLAPGSGQLNFSLVTRHLTKGEVAAARSLALEMLNESDTDADAHLILGMLDIEAGMPDRFLSRIQDANSKIYLSTTTLRSDEIKMALIVALANLANGREETARPLLQAVIDTIEVPRSREHLQLAAAFAMQGKSDLAISELRTSPPGWVRANARLLMRDPRFMGLRDLPEFQELVASHIMALDSQRVAYQQRD